MADLIRVPDGLNPAPADETIAVPAALSTSEASTRCSHLCMVIFQDACGGCEFACTSTCETSCQDCQSGCEVTCQSACEQACQLGCQGLCQTCEDCESSCENGCESGCEVSCQGSCESSCQGCESSCQGCEGACEYACENTCQSSCEGCESCEDACESSCQTTCESSCQGSCQSACQGACELGGQTPGELGVIPWTWLASNGSATDAQTTRTYEVCVGERPVNEFCTAVWNDLVDKVAEMRSAVGEWDLALGAYYPSSQCKITASSPFLTVTKYNSVRYNVGSIKATGIQDVVAGQQIYGRDFIVLADVLNQIIEEGV